jgi:O-antigen/teichoic acid export membrane protein
MSRLGGSIALTIALAIEKLCYLASMLIVSRILSVADFGRYSFALYAGFMIATLAEFGFQPILVRDIVATPEQRRQLLGTALLLKLPLALLSAVGIGAMILYGRFDQAQSQLLWILGLGQIAVAISYVANAVFRATQRLELEGLSACVRGLLYLAASAGVLFAGLPLRVAALAIMLANLASMALALGLASNLVRPAWPADLAREGWAFLSQTAPMACSTIVTAVFATLSVVVLRLLMDSDAVGWYNSAHALNSHTGFIPEVVTAALLPPMVVALQRDKDDRRPLTEMLVVMLGCSLPIALGTTLLAPQILTLVYGTKFLPAATTLMWLIWTAPFSFVNVAYLLFLSARKQQHRWLALVLVGIVLTALSLWVLIPFFGSLGAAMARLVGEGSVCLLGTWMLRRSIDYRRLLRSGARLALALLGLFVAVWLSQSAPVVVPIALGAVIYAVAVAMLGPWPIAVWRAALNR